jgi:hypothetical protein
LPPELEAVNRNKIEMPQANGNINTRKKPDNIQDSPIKWRRAMSSNESAPRVVFS